MTITQHVRDCAEKCIRKEHNLSSEDDAREMYPVTIHQFAHLIQELVDKDREVGRKLYEALKIESQFSSNGDTLNALAEFEKVEK